MRAALIAEGLARTGALWTAVIPVSDPGVGPRQMRWIAERSTTAVLIPLADPAATARGWLAYPLGRQTVAAAQPLPTRARLASPVCGEKVVQSLGRNDFDLIYVLRLYLTGAAIPWLQQIPKTPTILDVDEDDAAILGALADLQWRRGDTQAATQTRAEASAYGRFAAACLPWFGTIVTASTLESKGLDERYALPTIVTLPNAVRLRGAGDTRFPEGRSLRLIYIGNLDYLPNLDAVERLATRILPLLRRTFPNAQLDIIGAGGGATVAALGAGAGVKVHGQVMDLEPFYRRADLTIVPLRAGGGSRLKILEAFANGIPVIATPEAIAGLEVEAGRELMVAETDQALVRAAFQVATDATLAQRIVTQAAAFVASYHDREKIADRLAELVGDGQVFRHESTL